ncbi:Uncharacterized protein HZ326_28497 [Fusarium oxysporum f. sp. albedinis]|nr:Uncharacterized protein HZ326_28497 [Fusarium oxysporum f. sp. albedinis]
MVRTLSSAKVIGVKNSNLQSSDTREQHPSNCEKMLVPESDRESHPIRSRLDGSVVERVTSNDKVHGSIPCRGKRVLPCVLSLFCVFLYQL